MPGGRPAVPRPTADEPAPLTRRRTRRSKLEASSLEGDFAPQAEPKPVPAPTQPQPPLLDAAHSTRKVGRVREFWIDFLESTSNAIIAAAREIKVLPSLEWEPELKQRFFATGEKEPPRPVYPDRRAELESAAAELARIRQTVQGRNPIEAWFRNTCDSYETAARMLAACGTDDFYRYSRELYGDAGTKFVDGVTTNADLAKHLARTLSIYRATALGVVDVPRLKASEVAPLLEQRFQKELPGEGITVTLTDEIASKAIAGPDRVRLRKDALLSEREVEILVHHEGLVHVATTINGRNQPHLKLLAKGAPRTMRIQEGLAVFAEFMSGAIDVDRVRRLADRTIAIEMSQNGAGFVDLYRFFRERGDEREEAFDNAQRVVRGGKVDGGAPFTKDVIYLDGLTRIHGYLHVAVPRGRLDDVARLFCGKIALEDLPALRELEVEGVLAPPKHMPMWAKDLRFLAAYLAYTNFLKRLDLSSLHTHFSPLFASEDSEVASVPDDE